MVEPKGQQNSVTLEADDAIQNLVSDVEGLLFRVTGNTPTIDQTSTGMRLVSDLNFSDEIGQGLVAAEVFHYRDSYRIDVRIEHNRVFALASGRPSDKRCFLNDFVASIRVEQPGDGVSNEFCRQVVAGISAAKDAVGRHNRKARGPWDEVRVASSEADLLATLQENS